jgi:branched-chain amino acid transport system permease protein
MADPLTERQPAPRTGPPAGALRASFGDRRGRVGDWIWPLGFLALALAVPYLQKLLPNGNEWMDMRTVITCMVFVLLAIGLNIVVGYAGLLDLGYVAFWAIGAYVFAWLASTFWNDQNVHFFSTAKETAAGIHVSFWLVIIVGAIVCAIAGVIIGAPTLRLRGDYLAIVTLGFGEIIPQAVRNGDQVGGTNVTNGAQGINGLDKMGFGSTLDSATGGFLPEIVLSKDVIPRYYIIMLFCVLAVFVSLRLREGKLGRAWIAIREDELAASAMGIALMRTKLWAYAIGACFGGVAGVFYAAHIGGANPDSFFFNISVLILCMVILGGMGNVYGVILGAFFLAWLNFKGLEFLGDSFNNAAGTDIAWADKSFLFFGIILVATMLLRPEGLLPAARQKRLITERVDEQSSTLAPGNI